MPIFRFINSGAVFASRLRDLADLRRRYTVAGAPTIVDSPYGHVIRLDGTNDYITLTEEEEYNLRFDSGAQDFSVVAWVREDGSVAVRSHVIDKRDANADGWRLWFSPANNIVYGNINALAVIIGPPIVDTLWHHVAMTVDRSGNGLIYVDGIPGVGTAMGDEVMATTAFPRVGANSFDTTEKWKGDIYAIVVYDRILSPEEILDLATNKSF